MKHTPGPWSIDVLADTTNIESRYQTIAVDVSNCDANLIASAPDLLATLEFVRAIVDGMPSLNAVSSRIDRVIVKAHGLSKD